MNNQFYDTFINYEVYDSSGLIDYSNKQNQQQNIDIEVSFQFSTLELSQSPNQQKQSTEPLAEMFENLKLLEK